MCRRQTKETQVEVEILLDGSGRADVATGIGILDHLLEQVARHGLLDISLRAQGDLARDEHHLVEDVGIALGRALHEALGERTGIVRMAHALVPMDEALALVALDLGGRGHAALEISFGGPRLGGMATELIGHLLRSLASEGRLTLHASLLAGADDHHRAEAVFKALGRALGEAVGPEPRLGGQAPSTKGVID